MAHAHPRQTKTFLMRRLESAGILPKTRFGQNFLIDLNLHDVLVAAANLTPQDVVLEVGTGTASITTRLAQVAAAVITVEVDYQLATLAAQELEGLANVTLLRQDALRNKNNLEPSLMQAVRAAMQAGPGRKFKLVANLPYNIATPLISNLLLETPVPQQMVITIQKELADRLVAVPSTKDYGALTAWVQSQADVEIVRILPPQVFWPRPLVHSAIVSMQVRPELRLKIPDLTFFHQFCRTVFFHRRKFLRSVLASGYKRALEKSEVDTILSGLELSGEVRAEALDLATLQRLCESIRQHLLSKGVTSLEGDTQDSADGTEEAEDASEHPTA